MHCMNYDFRLLNLDPDLNLDAARSISEDKDFILFDLGQNVWRAIV